LHVPLRPDDAGAGASGNQRCCVLYYLFCDLRKKNLQVVTDAEQELRFELAQALEFSYAYRDAADDQ